MEALAAYWVDGSRAEAVRTLRICGQGSAPAAT